MNTKCTKELLLKGEGQFLLAWKLVVVKPRDVLRILPKTLHAILAHTDLELIEVQTGAELVEEDIIRICLEWEETGGFLLTKFTFAELKALTDKAKDGLTKQEKQEIKLIITERLN